MADQRLGYTKQELIAAAIFPIGYKLSDYTATGDLQTQLNMYFDEAIQEICHRHDWRFLHQSWTWEQSEGNTYDLGNVRLSNAVTDIAKIEALFITTEGKGKRIFKSDWKNFVQQDPTSIFTGDPENYDRWREDELIFDRTINSDLNFLLMYQIAIPMITAPDQYPIIPRRWQPNIRNYIRWKVASDKGDSRAAQFYQEYEDKILKDITDDGIDLDGGDQRIKQPNEICLTPGYQPTMQDVWNRVLG